MRVSASRCGWLFILNILACLSLFGSPAAHADTDYHLDMINETPQSLHIRIYADKCTLMYGGVARDADVVLGTHQTWALDFVRHPKPECHGGDGKVAIWIFDAGRFRLGSELSVFDVAFSAYYWAQGSERVSNGNVHARLQHIRDGVKKNVDLISVVFHDTAAPDASQAVQQGCYTPIQLTDELGRFAQAPDLGDLTRKLLSRMKYARSTFVSIGQVTRGQWVYRATAYPAEIESLLRGRTLSNASRNEEGPTYWQSHGPRLSGPTDRWALAMRLMAISQSYSPDSQFSSVALSPDVAKSFIAGKNYEYAFWMVPWSEVLGMTRCRLSAGELQFQPFGGTRIFDLHRWNGMRGARWEKYDYVNKRWNAVDYVPGAGS